MRRLHKHCCPECGTVNVPPEGFTYEDKRFCDVKCYRTWYKKGMTPKYARNRQT